MDQSGLLIGPGVFNNTVKTKEVEITTSANGNGSVSFDSNVIVIGAYAKRSDTILRYFAGNAGSATASGTTTWWINAVSAISPFEAVANTEMTVYVNYYIP